MPYLEDGETWVDNPDLYEEGFAENKPGHKKFSAYKLPKWTQHPLTHPMNGIVVNPKDYYHAAGDGYMNPMGWSIAHVACKFGDIEMLDMCTPEELSHPTYEGHTPAHYAVQHGTPWCLQWLSEHGADVTSPDYAGLTPEETIWRNPRLHNNEMEWCFQAIRGELTEKNAVKAQEYRLVKFRCAGHDKSVTEKLDREMLKMRKFWYGTGEYKFQYNRFSPEDLAKIPLDLPSSKVFREEMKEPPLPVAMLFPGEGSQYVGMLKEVMEKPKIKAMLSVAHKILGWDPLELCLKGPDDKLGETRYCQPIMYIGNLCAMELLRESKSEEVDRVQAVAGLSLGEYAAVVAAGVLTFEEGLHLVKLRAESMQRAEELSPQSVCSVVGLDRAKVDKICEEAKSSATQKPAECSVAQVLFPSGFMCAGSKECVGKVCKLAMQMKALQSKESKMKCAFHTSLMRPAQDELNTALEDLRPKMKPPRCSIYFNATGRQLKAGTDPSQVIELLGQHVASEVLWEATIRAMIVDGVKDFFEVGPGKQLKSMIKRIDPEAFRRTENAQV